MALMLARAVGIVGLCRSFQRPKKASCLNPGAGPPKPITRRSRLAHGSAPADLGSWL